MFFHALDRLKTLIRNRDADLPSHGDDRRDIALVNEAGSEEERRRHADV